MSACAETCRRSMFFGEGVGEVVDTREGVEVEVGIALSGRNAAMPKQFLHGSQVGTAFQHMCGKGMPQVMRGNVLEYARQFGVLIKDACGLTAVQPFASFAKEYCPFAMMGRNLVAGFQPSGQSGYAGVAEQYLPLL